MDSDRGRAVVVNPRAPVPSIRPWSIAAPAPSDDVPPAGGTRPDPRSRPVGSSDALLRARCAALARRHGVVGAQLAIHRSDGGTVAVEVGELEHNTARAVRGDAAFPVGSI